MQRLYTILCTVFGFTVASLLVFATVAFFEGALYKSLGLLTTYTLWILLFMGSGSILIHRAVRRIMTIKRFATTYCISFFVYSCAWMVSYFAMQNTKGEWLGSITGSIAIACAFAIIFKMPKKIIIWSACFFICHSLGYFAGSYIFTTLYTKNAMILWGVCYGIGTGAGLGYILHDIKQKLII